MLEAISNQYIFNTHEIFISSSNKHCWQHGGELCDDGGERVGAAMGCADVAPRRRSVKEKIDL